VATRLVTFDGVVARLARELVDSRPQLTGQIHGLDRELDDLVVTSPRAAEHVRLRHPHRGEIVRETTNVRHFRSRHAFVRHDATASLPAWSSNHARYRLSHSANRQINAAIRIAITQARHHEAAR
jgi:hypothetical protein